MYIDWTMMAKHGVDLIAESKIAFRTLFEVFNSIVMWFKGFLKVASD